MIERDLARGFYHSDNWSSSTKELHMYHYTTTEVLDALLNRCTFRASNIFYLNDSEEYKAGINAIKKTIANWPRNTLTYAKIQNALDNLIYENGRCDISEGVYTISFSYEEDLLSQWITYAKEGGVAIELDNRLIPKWYGIEESNIVPDYNTTKIQDLLFFLLQRNLREIIYQYDSKHISDIVTEMAMLNSYNASPFMWLASYFKTSSFSAEKEIRISVLPIQNNKNNMAKIHYHYMNGRGVLRPYLNIILGYRSGDYFKPCLPLKTITIGPAGNQQAVFNSVVHRIKYGSSHVFDYSKSPSLLKENIIDFTLDILTWLTVKDHIHSFSKPSNKPTELIYIINKLVKAKDERALVRCLLKSIIIDISNIMGKSTIQSTLGQKILTNTFKITKSDYNKNGIDFLNSIHKRILREIYDDFYFSKEGIIIKKSAIPYIF